MDSAAQPKLHPAWTLSSSLCHRSAQPALSARPSNLGEWTQPGRRERPSSSPESQDRLQKSALSKQKQAETKIENDGIE